MEKQVIFKPAKGISFGLKQLKRAVRELGVETAEEVGIELLRVGGIYYVVKNIYNDRPELGRLILNTIDATERVAAREIVKLTA